MEAEYDNETTENRLLNELKCKITGSLGAYGSNGCTLRELMIQFLEDWDQPLSYLMAQLKYPNPISMLKAMPDLVILSEQNREWHCTLIPDENICEIIDIIDATAAQRQPVL